MSLRRLILGLIFFSGASALIYEVLWMRMLLLIFGSTTKSVVVVVSAFMAGLALGSWLFGRVADKFANRLRLYGLLEVTTGVTAVATPFLFGLVTQIYVFLYPLSRSEASLGLSKFVLTFAVLLLPTVMMGGTLPVVVRLFRERFANSLSQEVSSVYAANTLGALGGTILAAVILIEVFGLRASVYLAAAINLAIGLVALFVSSRQHQGREKSESERPVGLKSEPLRGNPYFLGSVIFGFSGLISMAYEVLWTRLLTPFTGPFIYAFALILATFLLGIAFGSFVYQKLSLKRYHPIFLLGLAELGVALGAMLSVLVVSFATAVPVPLLLAIVVLPATICMGLTFPIVSALPIREGTTGSFIGNLYALNTLGSIIGPMVAAFFLIPYLGTSRAVLVGASGNGVLSLVALLSSSGRRARAVRDMAIFTVGTLLLFVVLASAVVPEYFLPANIKIFRSRLAEGNFSSWYFEDEVASVFAFYGPNPNTASLLVDGIGMSNLVDETKLMGHLPFFVRPNAKSALVVAFGMGTTFRSVLSHNAYVDSVDLVPSVPKMFPLFFPDAKTVRSDPKGKIIINDGRNFVLLADKKYDIIISDPPPPANSSGTTLLYAKNFYHYGKRLLNPGGIFLQWLYFGTRLDDYRMLAKSFLDEFPYVAVFRAPLHFGLYFLGSDRPIVVSRTDIARELADEKVSSDLSEWSKWDVDRVVGLYYGDKQKLLSFVGGSAEVTDDHPLTEYFILRHFFSTSPVMSEAALGL